MKTVRRYKIPRPTPGTELEILHVAMPEGARIVKVWASYGVPCVLAIVDTDKEDEERHVVWVREDRPMPEMEDHVMHLDYVGSTCPTDELLHLFEVVAFHTPQDEVVEKGGVV